MSIREREEALFQKWSRGRESFVRDGVVDEGAYASSEPKILFVLKETNGAPNPEHDLRLFLHGGGMSKTWDNVVRWARAIRDPRDWSWSEAKPVSDQDRVRELSSLAVMNVRKTPGGGSTERARLEAAARDDRDRLRAQVEIYEPAIIVAACGEARYVPQLDGEGWEQTRRGMWYRRFEGAWGPAYGLSVWHPQSQYPHRLMFFAVLDAVREIGGAARNQR